MNWIGVVAFLAPVIVFCILDISYSRRHPCFKRESDATSTASIWPSEVSPGPHEGVTSMSFTAISPQDEGELVPPAMSATEPVRLESEQEQEEQECTTFRLELETRTKYRTHSAFSDQQSRLLFNVYKRSLEELQQIRQVARSGQPGNEAEDGEV